MPDLQPCDVVVTSGDRTRWQSRLIMWFSNSTWTHVFLVKDETTLIESYFPVGVAEDSLAARFAELAANGQTYRVLRLPDLTTAERQAILLAATGMLGRKYDILQAVVYGLFHVFIQDGPMRVICSRFITVACSAARDLFPAAVLDARAGHTVRRYDEMRKGWVTPEDLLEYSVLSEVDPIAIPRAA